MAKSVYAIASNIVSSLGMDIAAHWQAVAMEKIGIKKFEDISLSNTPFQASKIGVAEWQYIDAHTKISQTLFPFEQLALFSARQALQDCEELNLSDTVLILSTTKGNIELLGQIPDERLLLHASAHIIAKELGISSKQIVISHACVSGIVALLYGLRLLQAGRYKHAIVIGCDRFSRFVLSGFQSFQAISETPCKPFDKNRSGISLGEAAATIILSSSSFENSLAEIISGSTSNDANHISGPSRTGEELALAIKRALGEANLSSAEIDMISAHGTATAYNDEMEAKAFDILGLNKKPIHSFKGYVGHTLGAAGVVESAMVIESLKHQQLIPSAGFQKMGVSVPLNISTSMSAANIKYALKTASGFGGSNAAVIWKRI
ncbi:MAG TPA: beta-ketoacyl synthase N-terminal-like domain-containing protein [Flavipsychrobacter sp.]|nr:beta-ketoacyl synthase N-terminal-like domain-containing protein [Flavipsychrobacter sp.]